MGKVLLHYTNTETIPFIVTALEDEGYQVAQVLEEEDILQQTISFCPQVILLDFSLPSAVRLCSELKELHPDVAIIALCHNHLIANEFSLCGFNGYVIQPFHVNSLCAVIELFAHSHIAHAS